MILSGHFLHNITGLSAIWAFVGQPVPQNINLICSELLNGRNKVTFWRMDPILKTLMDCLLVLHYLTPPCY